ncbi:MAG: hypothetical protein IPP97_20020 [Candidatus Obscuribacter sp.]|nr:hypothetical protein [Candidatus Obscuribacter sp.]MBL0188022.1 hypothetical protein [Candidatus Obscuribacter sp.]MBP6595315.1 hypothetical protein [Candidatus Obscuribacter sp.]MBP7576518.1 hypothetical protein [Candidatus Obscuribacter sp.]
MDLKMDQVLLDIVKANAVQVFKASGVSLADQCDNTILNAKAVCKGGSYIDDNGLIAFKSNEILTYKTEHAKALNSATKNRKGAWAGSQPTSSVKNSKRGDQK